MNTLIAITRELGDELASCELTHLERTPIDMERALRQHRAYEQALVELGCEPATVPAAEGLADAVFIEDTALVLDEFAVLCRPGAVSRRPEVEGVAQALSAWRELKAIEAPGTLDGGDLLRVGRSIYAGLSSRSNAAGIEQLRALVAPHGYAVTALETRDCLHLKSAVTQVGDNTLLINPDWIDEAAFAAHDLIAIDPSEPHAANALRIGDRLIYPGSFPKTLEILREHGFDVTVVDVSELQKAEGAVTCCSLLLNAN